MVLFLTLLKAEERQLKFSMPLARSERIGQCQSTFSWTADQWAAAQRGKSEQAARERTMDTYANKDLANVSQPAKMSITGGIPFVPKKSPEKFGPYLMPQLPPEVSEEQKENDGVIVCSYE